MFVKILNVKYITYKNSFNIDQQAVIVDVELEEGTNKNYIIGAYASYVHEWPLGNTVSSADAEELKVLLRSYDIHKAACELGSV